MNLNQNILLPQLNNAIINEGFVHILSHQSVAVRRFGNRYKNQGSHYADQLVLKFGQWAEDMAQYKAPSGGKMMTHADLVTGEEYQQIFPIIHHGCASQMIVPDVMKRAMGSREAMAEFVADMVELAIARGAYAIDKKFMEDICKLDNYASQAIFANEEDFYRPGNDTDGTPKIRKIRNSMTATASAMSWPSRIFNKAGLMANSLSPKRIGVIISDEQKGNFRDYFGSVANLEYAELNAEFAWVETMPIHRYGFHIIFISEDGYVLNIDEESATGWDESRKAFRGERWFYKWVDAFQGTVDAVNRACWVVKEFGKKKLITDFKDLHSTFTADQAQQWEAAGFDFEQTKAWIEAGIKVDDAEYVKWLVTEKAQTEPNAKIPHWAVARDYSLRAEFTAKK